MTAGEGDRPIPTVAFEGLREGIDDVRYATTLERLLRENRSPQAQKIQAALEEMRREWLSLSAQQALEPAASSVSRPPLARFGPGLNRMDSYRLQLAEWISQLWREPPAGRGR